MTQQPELFPAWQLQYQLQAAQQLYLEARLAQYEIPQMRLANERERHSLAMQYASMIAQQSGWIVPMETLDWLYNPDVQGAMTPQEMIGAPGAMPTMEREQMMANPRNFVQSLIGLGKSPQEIQQFLGGSPLYQSMTQAQPTTQMQGWNMPFQQTDLWRNQGSPQISLMESIASFGGKDPNQYWMEQESRRPRGEPLSLTQYV